MKKTSFPVIPVLTACLLLLTLSAQGPAAGSEFDKAEHAFEKGLFQEAFDSYQAVYKGAGDAELKWKSFFRMCESLTHLFRYGEAADLIFNVELPAESPMRARVLLFQAGMARPFLREYYYIISRNEETESGGKAGAFTMTLEQLRTRITATYEELWKMRDALIAMDLSKEGYYFRIDGVDLKAYPTLFDFTVQQWTDYLMEGAELSEKDLDAFIAESFRPGSGAAAALKAAGIMEEASAILKDKFPESSEYWKVRRLAIILSAAWDVYDAERIEDFRDRAEALFTSWMEKMKNPGPRALAGLDAAMIDSQLERFVAARQLCDKVIERWPDAAAAGAAKALRRQIINPQLSFSAEAMTPQNPKKITVSCRNLATVHFRAYKLKASILERLEKNPVDLTGLLNGSIRDGLGKEILAGRPDFQWSAATGDAGKHEYLYVQVAPPAWGEGIYLVAACSSDSFKTGETLWCSGLVNVTSLMMVETPGLSMKSRSAYYDLLSGKGGKTVSDSVYRYYTLDAATGKPVDKASVFAGWSAENTGWKRTALTTDAKGAASLNLNVSVSPGTYGYYYAYPLAKKGASYSYARDDASFWYDQPYSLEFIVQTDRPIYRPGDTVMAKISGVRRTADGYRTLDKTFSVAISAYDPNGNAIFEKSIVLNEFGSADVSFPVPKGKLLGRYGLNVQANKGVFTGSSGTGFQVEEYKRPEFEIVFDPADKPVQFGRQTEISGAVSYYFGGAAADSEVGYRVTCSSYVPWYFRSWFFGGGYGSGSREIASGTIRTDSEGRFRVSFTPKQEDIQLPEWLRGGLAPEIIQYSVNVEARDSGGRTITGSTSCRAGKNGLYYTVEPDKGFFMETETPAFDAGCLSVNDKPLSGKASYEVHELKNPKLRTWEEMGYGYYSDGRFQTGLPGAEYQLKDAENARLAERGTVEFGKDGRARISLGRLAPGAYGLAVKGRDESGAEVSQRKIFLVVNASGRDVPVNFTAVTLMDRTGYNVGETAHALIGSRFTSGTYVVELWAGGYFIRSMLLDDARPVRTLDIPVTAEMKGGFTLRWFGVRDLETYYGEESAEVDWSEKDLTVRLEPFTETLKPGEKASWGVKTVDAAGKPVKSEVLVLMYDRSLEYYSTGNGGSYSGLYAANPSPETAGSTAFTPRFFPYPLSNKSELYRQLYVETVIPEEKLPGFRTDATYVLYKNKSFGLRASGYSGDSEMLFDLAEEKSVAKPEAAAAPAPVTALEPVGGDKDGRARQEGLSAPAVQARQAFADTAFFLPHVTTDAKGEGRFSFTAPEQLTGWKIRTVAFTPDVSWGELEETAVTKKDLMVRLDLPRYFREKDKGTVTVVVHNESDKPMTGQVWIDVQENGSSILNKIKLVGGNKSFTAPARGLAAFDWSVEIPDGIGAYAVRAVVKAGDLTDAEERQLPILPSRQRLIESAFAVLKGSESKTVSIAAGADPTRINESVTLEIDPQLAMSLLGTLPFLIDYPYSCVEQSLNKYVPLAIVNEIYGKYSEVKKAVAKLPKRATVTPPWEDKDPLRSIQIDETPWGWEAKGRPAIYPVIDMLDPAVVAAQKENVLGDLKSSQLSSGAFPWWPGGREDLYMTIYVLAGLSEALRYGVTADADMVNRALAYVNKTVPENFKPEPYQLAIVSFAAYAVTGFPEKDFKEAAKSRQLAAGWLDYLYKNRFALTPFGKGYLAHVYYRLGDAKKGDEVLAMALDGAREDPVAGVYWTPEAYSWVWYSDTVEKHAFFLKTLLEFKPNDKRIDGMARWLLWNRKGNVWKSTKASSAALYALFDYMQKGGALLSDEKFTVDWGGKTESLSVKGDDFLGKPLSIERGADVVGDKGVQALIKKEGKGTSFASLTWIYSTDQLPEASGPGLIELERTFYVREKSGTDYKLREIKSGDTVAVGDQIEVAVRIRTKSQFEYMHLKDPKAAGFEAETLLSGWKYDPLWFYEEPRDSSTNFFLDRLPHGEYVLRYRLRPTKPGEYRVGAATLQSMYAPDLNAHSAGFLIKVKK